MAHTTRQEATVKVVKVRGEAQYGVQCSHCGDLLETLTTRQAARELGTDHTREAH